MAYSFSRATGHIAVVAALSTLVTLGSAFPAAASQSTDLIPAYTACPIQSVFSIVEHAIETVLFGTADPCGLATSAASTKDVAPTGPVHPILDFLLH